MTRGSQGGQVGIFATRRRGRSSTAVPGASATPVGGQAATPAHFAAVAEALASGTSTVTACEEAGRVLAGAGTDLAAALDDLRLVHRSVRGTDPGFEELRALSMAWSETTLAHLQHVSCEDPLTGLATRAHLRSRLVELYAAQRDAGDRHALVVVEASPTSAAHRLGDDLGLASIASTVRTVFAAGDPAGRLGVRRIVVLATRDARTGDRVGLLRRMVERSHPGTRVWMEGLAPGLVGSTVLLDELARN